MTVLPGYTAGGTPGDTYAYVGTSPASFDLTTVDYTSSSWVLIGGSDGASYTFIGTPAQGTGLDLNTQDYADASLWQQVIGTIGTVYEYTGPAATVNLSNANYGGASWTPVTLGGISSSATESATITATSIAASAALTLGAAGISFTDSGADSQNVILTDTNAFINNAQVSSSGDVALSANDTASITAQVDSLSASIGVGAAPASASRSVPRPPRTTSAGVRVRAGRRPRRSRRTCGIQRHGRRRAQSDGDVKRDDQRDGREPFGCARRWRRRRCRRRCRGQCVQQGCDPGRGLYCEHDRRRRRGGGRDHLAGK